MSLGEEREEWKGGELEVSVKKNKILLIRWKSTLMTWFWHSTTIGYEGSGTGITGNLAAGTSWQPRRVWLALTTCNIGT